MLQRYEQLANLNTFVILESTTHLVGRCKPCTINSSSMLFEPTQTSIFIFRRLSILSFQLFCNHNPSCDKCLQVGDCIILGHINTHKCANWEGEATPKNAHGSSSRLSSCKHLPKIHIYVSLRNVQRYVQTGMNDAWVLHKTCKITLITCFDYKSRPSVDSW